MRTGTVLSYNTQEFGQSNGVVNELLSPSTVKCFDEHGGEYIVGRGQGHKHENQDSQFCEGLRQRFGITVGPCQKEVHGAEAVRDAKSQFVQRVKAQPKINHGLPVRIMASNPKDYCD